eukprot:1158055-Pelagomonas_calceolata.AAC.2
MAMKVAQRCGTKVATPQSDGNQWEDACTSRDSNTALQRGWRGGKGLWWKWEDACTSRSSNSSSEREVAHSRAMARNGKMQVVTTQVANNLSYGSAMAGSGTIHARAETITQEVKAFGAQQHNGKKWENACMNREDNSKSERIWQSVV